MNFIVEKLTRIDPKLRLFLALIAVALMAFEAWIFIIKPPYLAMQNQRMEKQKLELVAKDAELLPAQIAQLKTELAKLNQQILGSKNSLSTDGMVVRMVDDLARIGKKYDVALGNVKPADAKGLVMFDEVNFDINARGTYEALYQWLHAVEKELGPLAVTQIDLRRASQGNQISLSLKLSAYHLASTKTEKSE